MFDTEFQFHKVRLRHEDGRRMDVLENMFQFHKVRLRLFNTV